MDKGAKEQSSANSPYPEVRSLERALSILDALGELGWSGPTTLARKTGVDRATVYRLLATLINCGYVQRRAQDGQYFLSRKLKYLSTGIRDDDIRIQLVNPALVSLVKRIHWPSDFGAVVSGKLTIVDSNYPHTTMTLFRSVLGQTRPIMRSALGRAILAAMDSEQLDETVDTVIIGGGVDADEIADRTALAEVIESTRRRGYAISAGETTPGIGAIALPVMAGSRVAGAVNVVIFLSQFEIEKVAAEYLAPLRDCVKEIETAFASNGVF